VSPPTRQTALLAALVVAAGLGGCSLGGDDERPPQLGAKAGEEDAAAKLGFPASATRNTLRVGGGDAASDVAGVANAVFPSTSDTSRPTAVVIVSSDDWQAGVTASVLAGNPISAPILLSEDGDLPAVSKDTLNRLKPRGSDLAKDAQVIRVGSQVARPGGYRTAVIEGADPYERAAAIDRFVSVVRGKPSANVIVTSGEKSEWAMPAAAWAARSGDAVLLTRRDSVPAATRAALRRHERPSIYVLGPRQSVSTRAAKRLEKFGRVHRIEGPTPVQNAIAFARYQRGRFGWGVTVPGYNFSVASTTRPLDAAAAASLATRGVFAPLLLTDRADDLPKPLESYLLSVQPGFEDDPGEAVYNRIWVLGDDKVVSIDAQSRLDQVSELIPVQSNAP
jgi:hypothetical protein